MRLPVAAVDGEEKRLAGAAGVLAAAAPPKLNPAEGVDATGAAAVPPKLNPPADGAAGVAAGAAEEGVPKENAPAVEAAGAAPNAGVSDDAPPKLKVLEVAEEPNVGAAELEPKAGAADEEVAPNVGVAELVAPNDGADEPNAGAAVEAAPPKLNVLDVAEEPKVGAAELDAPKAGGGAELVAGVEAAPPKLNVLEADDPPKAGAEDVVLPNVAAGVLLAPNAGVEDEAAPNVAVDELVAPNAGRAELAAGVDAAPPKLKVLGVAEEPNAGATDGIVPKAGVADEVAPKDGNAEDVVLPKVAAGVLLAPNAGEADLDPKVAVEVAALKAGKAGVVELASAEDPPNEKAPAEAGGLVEPRVNPEELDEVAVPNVEVEEAGAAVPKEKAGLLEAGSEAGVAAAPNREVAGADVVVVDGAADEAPNENFEGPAVDELREAAKLGSAVVVAGVALPRVKPDVVGVEVAGVEDKENDGLGASDWATGGAPNDNEGVLVAIAGAPNKDEVAVEAAGAPNKDEVAVATGLGASVFRALTDGRVAADSLAVAIGSGILAVVEVVGVTRDGKLNAGGGTAASFGSCFRDVIEGAGTGAGAGAGAGSDVAGVDVTAAAPKLNVGSGLEVETVAFSLVSLLLSAGVAVGRALGVFSGSALRFLFRSETGGLIWPTPFSFSSLCVKSLRTRSSFLLLSSSRSSLVTTKSVFLENFVGLLIVGTLCFLPVI